MFVGGCTGSAIRTTTMQSFEPPVASIAAPQEKKTEKDNTVSAIYNGKSGTPVEAVSAIPYWIMENGEAKSESIYFKPLYIVVN